MPRALLSVWDKRGLGPFARSLSELGFELVSTGGTFTALEAAGLAARHIEDITGFPEILGGRVKTLHPRVHGGILARREPEHLAELAAYDIVPIDLVAVNLYPFREVTAAGATLETALEHIDIGGPSMLRAAAKNFMGVYIVVDPEDYDEVVRSLRNGEDRLEFRKHLAVKAFAHSAAYDAAVARYLGGDDWPEETALEVHKLGDLRYGENPHQRASLWRLGGERGPIVDAEVLHGKAMSFNNYGDAEAAWNMLLELPGPAAVAVKHASPCGAARAESLLQAYRRARDADLLSIFGGVVALDGRVTLEVAEELSKTFLEIVLAPDYDEAALTALKRKKNLRLLRVTLGKEKQVDVRRLRGGLLVQDMDEGRLEDCALTVATKRGPSEEEWRDLRFAWTVAKFVKSNAIVLAKGETTTGIGAGQVSRIWAAQGAIRLAGDRARGSVMASDAFFPFDDAVREAAKAGVTAVIQPGGSVRDEEVTKACDELGLAMVFTGMRHFRH
jgi:phosphoribosylaminoimidazolecarboxamide formyltransferase / IMP cyclohydrolase